MDWALANRRAGGAARRTPHRQADEIVAARGAEIAARGSRRRRHHRSHHAACSAWKKRTCRCRPNRIRCALVEKHGFSYKRYRASLKKRDLELVARFRSQLEEVTRQAHAGELALCFVDESGFSPSPPLQSGWSLCGQARAYCPVSHQRRMNVLGCLQKGGRLVWETLAHTVPRGDVIAFFDRLADQIAHKTVVVLDNAPSIAASRCAPSRGMGKERAALTVPAAV
jgi:hypothetical protein